MSTKLFVSEMDRRASHRWVRGDDDGNGEEDERKPSNNAARIKLLVLELAECCIFCATTAKFDHSLTSCVAASTTSGLSIICKEVR